MSILKLTSDNFDSEVMNSDRPVLIDFWAAWCGPCKMLSPIVDEIAEEFSDSYKVCKVNVDDEPELAGKFNVFSIPTLVVIIDGKVVRSSVGYKPKESVIELLKS